MNQRLRTPRLAGCALLLMLGMPFSVSAIGYVEKYEQMLTELGYDVGSVDDVFDLALDQGIRAFEQEKGLAVTGQLNAETRAAIESAHALKNGLPPVVMVTPQPRPLAPPRPSSATPPPPPAPPARAAYTETQACSCPRQENKSAPVVIAAAAPARSNLKQGLEHKSGQKGHQFRVNANWQASSTVLEDSSTEIGLGFTSTLLDGEYQSPFGLYARLALGRITLEEIEVNGVRGTVDETEDLNVFSIGYRIPRAHQTGLYWGLGYTRSSIDSSDTDIFALYSEKDQTRRYGRISIALKSDDVTDVFSVSGAHVWFGRGGHFGWGLNWQLGSGRTDTGASEEADVGEAAFGGLLMYRI